MTWFVDMLAGTSMVTQTIVSIAVMIVFGYLMTRLTKLIKLPNVTGYILAGILIGPYFLNLVPSGVSGSMDFLSDIALTFIAFSIGEFFKLDVLKKNGGKIILITIFEAFLSSIIVFCVMYFILNLDLSFSIVLGALASATAPSSTIMTIRQTKSKGEFVDTLLQVIALDNLISLIMYSIAISIAVASTSGSGINFGIIALPIAKNLGCILIGAVLGFALAGLMKIKHSSDNRLIIVICILFVFCAIASLMDVSPLLGCMVIGMVYINVTKDEKLFLQVNYFSPPILLIFFVSSGLKLNLSTLFASSTSIFAIPLWVIALVYFFTRLVGKYSGAYVGSLATKRKKEIRNYLGLALVPQSGVAIGLAVMGARILGGDLGNALQTIILSASVLHELIGPACAKISLYLSKSYSNRLENVVINAQKTSPNNTTIAGNTALQNDNAKSVISQEEHAFNDAGAQTLGTYEDPKDSTKDTSK